MSNSPHHTGHRQRLKERFLKTDGEGMPEYELLEMLLMQAIPRRDVKPLAKDLIAQYTTLRGVLSAPRTELEQFKGVGESVITTLRLAKAVTAAFLTADVQQKDVIKSKLQLVEYLFTRFSGLKHEEFHVVYLNNKNHVLGTEVLFKGTVNSSAVYPREVIKAALEKGATSIILAHNHPSGDVTPSDEDVLLTKEITTSARPLSIQVVDHIIIGDGRYASLKDKGLM